MLTLDKLKEMGIDPTEGLGRCMNNEAFYFKMVKMGLSNEYFESLSQSLAKGDLETAFEEAHALKGVAGNLALGTIYDSIADLTEKLRAKESADYVAFYAPIKAKRDELLAMC